MFIFVCTLKEWLIFIIIIEEVLKSICDFGWYQMSLVMRSILIEERLSLFIP